MRFKDFFNEKHCWKGYRKQGMKKKGKKLVNNCVKIHENDASRLKLSVIEQMFIENVGMVLAKVDSGNEAFNVLHGVDININSTDVSFTTVDNKKITAPLIDTTTIHIGSGVKEERPVVGLNIKLKGTVYKDVPFSIADRSENDEPVLIGEPFIKMINALIDVNLSKKS